jgi:Family of unknown function (DUF5519)
MKTPPRAGNDPGIAGGPSPTAPRGDLRPPGRSPGGRSSPAGKEHVGPSDRTLVSLRSDLEDRLQGLPGLERRRSRYGSSAAFYVGNTEVTHFHGEERMDVRLTKERIREMKETGPLDPRIQTRGPSAEWAAVRVREARDLALAVQLVEEAIRANS